MDPVGSQQLVDNIGLQSKVGALSVTKEMQWTPINLDNVLRNALCPKLYQLFLLLAAKVEILLSW